MNLSLHNVVRVRTEKTYELSTGSWVTHVYVTILPYGSSEELECDLTLFSAAPLAVPAATYAAKKEAA
jgi:hypothetical protein